MRRRSGSNSRQASADVAPGPVRTFAKLAPLERSFPKPAVRGIMQQGLAR